MVSQGCTCLGSLSRFPVRVFCPFSPDHFSSFLYFDLSGKKLASQNRSDHGGCERARRVLRLSNCGLLKGLIIRIGQKQDWGFRGKHFWPTFEDFFEEIRFKTSNFEGNKHLIFKSENK